MTRRSGLHPDHSRRGLRVRRALIHARAYSDGGLRNLMRRFGSAGSFSGRSGRASRSASSVVTLTLLLVFATLSPAA